MKAFLNREGDRISAQDAAMLTSDPNYVTVRHYDNGQMHAVLVWTGLVENYGSVFPSMYKLFRLNVFNYDTGGALVADPADNGRTFSTEEQAVAAYEELLLRWTQAELGAEGEVIDTGNNLAPLEAPKPLVPAEPELPPSPDRPASMPDEPELGGGGAW